MVHIQSCQNNEGRYVYKTWFNITQDDLNTLDKRDTMLQRQLITKTGNPCKVFMCLELGVVPNRYMIVGSQVKY